MILSDTTAAKSYRAEFTCEWLQRPLIDFFRSKDGILAIDGPAGSGKTVLSGWTEERLQRPLGRKSYETMSYTFEADVPSEKTSLAFVKGLVLQLLERDAGDAKLYAYLAKAYNALPSKRSHELEEQLWGALKVGLQTLAASQDVNLVIVIDGLDEVAGGEQTERHLCTHLQDISSKWTNIRSVVFGRDLSWNKSTGVRRIGLKADHVRDDISRALKAEIEDNHQYASQTPEVKDKVLDWVLDNAHQSFLWALLAWRLSKDEVVQKNDIQLVTKAPKTLPAILDKLFASISFSKPETKLLFAWLLAAERPLTLAEIQELYKINLQKGVVEGNSISRKHVEELGGAAIIIRNGIVRFRHASIRDYFLAKTNEGKTLIPLKDAQKDLTLRLLTYIKFHLNKASEPTFDLIDNYVVRESFRSYTLLEYAIRYWVIHFSLSSFYGPKGEIIPSNELKAAFPDTINSLLIEWTCWEPQTSITEALRLHEIALNVRQAIFTEKHISVLQTYIIIALIHQKLSNKRDASSYFYKATKIGRLVLHQYSTITIRCTTLFLSCTEDFTFTSRTEIATYKEEILRYMIEYSKHQNAHSDTVIRYHKLLAALYVSIHEEQRATQIYQELYEIIVVRFGKSSKEAMDISDDLSVTLRKDKKEEDVVTYNESIFETYEQALEVWDRKRIEVTIKVAEYWAAKGELFKAEQVYVTLWQRITEVVRTKQTTEMHLIKIDIALSYVEFLRRSKRIEEASNILIVIWGEYEHQAGNWEILIRLKKIGEVMKTVGLLTVAITVFTSVWGWFKKTGKADAEEARSTTTLISETVDEEITRKITTRTTTTTTTTKTTVVSEEVVRDVYAVTYERCKTTKNYTELLKATSALIKVYIEEERWQQVTETIIKTLEVSWKVLITGEGKLTLPADNTSEYLEIAIRLAGSYHRQHLFEKSEEIYLRLFHASLLSLKVDDERVTNLALVLVQFYEEHHRHEKAITIYAELLDAYKKHLGVTHTLTIKTLYKLGELSLLYGYKERGHKYYLEIVTTLNNNIKHCHPDAVQAAVILVDFYYTEKHWKELQSICAVLWETFVHHHQTYKFTETQIVTIYEKYLYVLENFAKVEYSVLYKITVEYRETTIKVFGAQSSIVTIAMVQLAKICERNEKHYHESITIYEEVLKRIKTTTTTTTVVTTISTIVTVEEIRRRLSRTYVKVIQSGGSTTPAHVERGIVLFRERFEEYKIKYGYWHENTLTELRELLLLYRKQNTKESHAIVVRTLQETVLKIITEETISSRLYSSAITLANIYLACELPEHGHEIIKMLRRQIIFKDTTDSSFVLEKPVGKVSYVFLVVFEETLLKKKTVSYTEIMVDLLTETFLYEQYSISLKKETNVEVILKYGAFLRAFLVVRKREHQIKLLDDQLFEVFLKKYGANFKTKRTITFIFYVSILEELGKEERHYQHVGHAACVSSANKVKLLMQDGKFETAYEVGQAAFQFLSSQKVYRYKENIGWGFKLSLYLAGREITSKHENKMHVTMLELSRAVISEVFAACREHNINFVQLKLEDLDALVSLLGDQQNYEYLEVSLNPDQLTTKLTCFNRFFSLLSGLLVTSKRLGPKNFFSEWAVVSFEHASLPDTTLLPFILQKTLHTIFVVHTVHSHPRLSPLPFSCQVSTPLPTVIVKLWLYLKKCFVLLFMAMTQLMRWTRIVWYKLHNYISNSSDDHMHVLASGTRATKSIVHCTKT
jgi:hypothetical protein